MALSYPNIDPVALDLGFIQVHWYGLMYLFGFIAAFVLGQKRAERAERNWRKASLVVNAMSR